MKKFKKSKAINISFVITLYNTRVNLTEAPSAEGAVSVS